MTAPPTNARQLSALVRQGEGPTLEFKRSTSEVKEAMQTLCAFLNCAGGMLLFGVRPDGRAEGQGVSDQTLRDIAQSADRFEPPADFTIHRIRVGSGREVLAVVVEHRPDAGPFTYDGRPYERVQSTTRKMPQPKYEKRLLDRAHGRRRWENEPVAGLALKDLDRAEILRTRELAIQQNRISPDTRRDSGEILDRLGLREQGVLTQAAQVLYGKRFLPDYPQCLLKMGRFRGTEVTGEIVDNRQEHMNAFDMLREGMAFLERTMPLGARFPQGTVFREDRFPVPLEALREILLNAVMHRDYSDASGHVAIAIFDARIEIRSYGRLPTGLTVEQLSGPHLSKPRNLLIAETFHRTGAVEVWGRGTNRVIDACKRHGAAPPVFEEIQDFLIVTFRARIAGAPAELESQLGSELESQLESLDYRVLAALRDQPQGKGPLARKLGQKQASGPLHEAIRALLTGGLIERTVPDKPQSSKQRYRLTDQGRQWLEQHGQHEAGGNAVE